MVREISKLAAINIRFGLSSIQNLKSITSNFDLCDIVAFDIALNNKDRGQNNYFFEANSNRYHAIDTGGIFSGIRDNQQHLSIEQEIKRFFPLYIFQKTASFMSYIFLKTLDVDKLSNKEIEALKRVNNTLKKLSDQFSADTLYSLWMQKAQEIKLDYPENKKAVLKLYIDYNDYYVKKVIAELEELTAIPQTPPKKEEIKKEELKEQKKIQELKEEASEALTKKLQLQQQIAHVVKEQPQPEISQDIQPLPFVQSQEIIPPPMVSADEPMPKSPFTPISESPKKQIKKKLDKEEKKPKTNFYQKMTEFMENMKAAITYVFNAIWSWLRRK